MNTVLERSALVTKNQVRPASSTTAMGRDGLGTGRIRVDSGWAKILASVEAMRTLTDDWDGDGATAPRAGVIETARELLGYLRAIPLPCPMTTGTGPTGSILLVWERSGRYFEIEIVAPGQAEWFRSEPGAPPAGGATIDRSIRALFEWSRA